MFKDYLLIALSALAIGAVVYLVLADPWFYENWPRAVMIFALAAAATGIGFLCGVAHGMKKGESEIERLTSEFLRED